MTRGGAWKLPRGSRLENLRDSPQVIEWLLEEENPCVRYLTLTTLLGRSARDRDAADARAKIPSWRPVARILANQLRSGGWERNTNWYIPKHRTSVWQLILLSQTGIDPTQPAVSRMCEYAFKFQSSPGWFVADRCCPMVDWARDAGCLNGNVVASLCRLGNSGDKRLGKAVDCLLATQEQDGGWGCRSVKSHSKAKHSCFMGAVCALDGLTEFARDHRSTEVRSAIERASEFVLMHRLYRADHHGSRIVNKDWLRLRSPWLVSYDILRGLVALTNAGVTDDPRMRDAVSVLDSKRTASGRWKREKHWQNNSYSTFGRIDREDKWVTLNALRVLGAVHLTR